MTHLGVSAIHFDGDFIHWLSELQDELTQRKRSDVDTVPGHTTINVGIVAGRHRRQHPGTRVRAELGLRTLPGDDAMEVPQ
jgi:acetylornithine deacetylase